MDDLVQFLRARLAAELERARFIGNTVITQHERMHVPLEAAEKQARSSLAAAESRLALFEDTVVPYLGTAGPGGRNAELQLRLLGAPYADHPGYRDKWQP